MKYSPLVLAAALGLVAMGGLRAAEAAQPARVDVVFDHPENFTDIKDRANPTDGGRNEILEAIRSYITSEARKYLPPGAQLTIVFTDIDLAGDFEPWRGPMYDDVRVVKPIYPPAFKFSYQVADAAGRTVKQGAESIRDLNFETRPILDQTDPLRIEKDILREWIRNNLHGVK